MLKSYRVGVVGWWFLGLRVIWAKGFGAWA